MKILSKWWEKLIAFLSVLTIFTGLASFFGFDFEDFINPPPMYVNLVGVKNEKIDKNTVPYNVDKTNSDHDRMTGTTVNQYKDIFQAEKGYRIVSYKFDKISATREKIHHIKILDSGKSIEIAYSLTAGPKTDQYRGWLKGKLVTNQEKIIPQMLVPLSQPFNAAIKNELNVGSIDVKVFDAFVLTREDGFEQKIELNKPIEIKGSCRSVELVKFGNEYVLLSKRKWF
ncbi:hypothetical protein HJ190_22965 [Vibrio parahaemolyticus]|nr:hypothetical protein [Vibrio parahaemolyticus]